MKKLSLYLCLLLLISSSSFGADLDRKGESTLTATSSLSDTNKIRVVVGAASQVITWADMKVLIDAYGDTVWQGIDADLTAIAALSGTSGFLTKTGTNTWELNTNTYLTTTGSAANLTDFPTLNQSTTGTAANVSGTPALPNGTTATTQTAADNSTKLATTAYADTAAGARQADMGITSITDSTSTTSSTAAASATAVKAAYDHYPTVTDSTSTTSSTTVASATAVKSAYDLANGKLSSSGSAASLTDFPTLNQNTTGTAANLSGTPALPNGTTATTQTAADNSTKLATTAYADAAAGAMQIDIGATEMTDAVDIESSTIVASATSVKLANERTGVNFTGTIAGGSATFPAATIGGIYLQSSDGYVGGDSYATARYGIIGDEWVCVATTDAGTEAEVGGAWNQHRHAVSMPDGERWVRMVSNTTGTPGAGENGYGFVNDVFKVYEAGVEKTFGTTSTVTTAKQSAQVTNNSNANMADVTGIAFSVTANHRYYYKILGTYQSASNTTGLVLAFTAPAITATQWLAKIQVSSFGTDMCLEGAWSTYTSVAVIAEGCAAQNTDYFFTIEGMIEPSASGTLQLQFRSEINASQVLIKNTVGTLTDAG